MTIAQSTPPTSLDPHFHNHGQSNANAMHVFDTLVTRNASMQLQPGLAVSWRVVDPLTWEFRMREGVRFHDGTPFTADDVAFSYQRVPNVPNSPGSFATYLRAVTSVTMVDPMTLRITTHEPSPTLAADLASVFIVSRRHGANATTEDYNTGRANIGTGPYRLAEYTPGERIVYAPNPDYWDGVEPWQRAIFRIISNPSSRVAALLAGDVHASADIPSSDVERIRRDARFQVVSMASSRVVHLSFDPSAKALEAGTLLDNAGNRLARNPLGDPRVRMALSLAVNRQALVERINEGEAVLTGQIVPEGFPGFIPGHQAPPFDPEGARRLLAEAGWPEGFRMTLSTSNDRIANSARMVQAIAQMWQRIGVKVEVELMPHAVFNRRRNVEEFAAFLSSWGNSAGDGLSTMVGLLHTRDRIFGAANRTRYTNPALDRLLQEASREMDGSRRDAITIAAHRLALEDNAITPVLLQVNNWGVRRGFVFRGRVDQATLAMNIRRAPQ